MSKTPPASLQGPSVLVVVCRIRLLARSPRASYLEVL